MLKNTVLLIRCGECGEWWNSAVRGGVDVCPGCESRIAIHEAEKVDVGVDDIFSMIGYLVGKKNDDSMAAAILANVASTPAIKGAGK